MSETPLKLTMIGPSGTGKSCYLYATYFRMLEGVAGFNFNCKDYNQARELANAWDVVLDEGVWPPGTAESEVYRFACMKDGSRIGEFSWLDYRGGLLNETGGSQKEEGYRFTTNAFNGFTITGGSQKEVDGFWARACSSDAILACVPADAILATRSESGKRNNQWGRIKVGLLGALAAIYQTTSVPSLIFLVTKSDLCKSTEDGRYCVETIRSSFAQYFSGKPKYAMIAATRMGRFSDDVVGFRQGEKIDGVVDPTNVHLPILFPFWQKAKDAQKGGVVQARENRNAAERAYNEAQARLEAIRVEKEKAREKWEAVNKRAKRFFIFAPILLVAFILTCNLLIREFQSDSLKILPFFFIGSTAALGWLFGFTWGKQFLSWLIIVLIAEGLCLQEDRGGGYARIVILVGIIYLIATIRIRGRAALVYERISARFKVEDDEAHIRADAFAKTKNELEAEEARSQATAALADAIWRELDGRVDLYEDGKRILNASGVEG